MICLTNRVFVFVYDNLRKLRQTRLLLLDVVLERRIGDHVVTQDPNAVAIEVSQHLIFGLSECISNQHLNSSENRARQRGLPIQVGRTLC